MPDSIKPEQFVGELALIETQVSILVEKYKDVLKTNEELQTRIGVLSRENEYYKLKVNELEEELERLKSSFNQESFLSSLDFTDREKLKEKISELIARLDYHLADI
ncbi:MAG TPA: cell division protein ZapB [Ignavibacteriaceae bacterium]|nr:cell division protein ZapB [Ignavibacteriaceae bacterium]